jgi:hypothetical protein
MKAECVELIQFIDETMEELRTIADMERARWFPNEWLLSTVHRVDIMLDDIRNQVAVL